jgi:hypothetical protein
LALHAVYPTLMKRFLFAWFYWKPLVFSNSIPLGWKSYDKEFRKAANSNINRYLKAAVNCIIVKCMLETSELCSYYGCEQHSTKFFLWYQLRAE